MSVAATGLNKLIFGDDAFGGKPVIENLEKIDPAKVQLDAVAGNLGVLPSAQVMAAKVNLFNQQQIDILTEMATPGRAAVRKQEGEVIGRKLRGELASADIYGSLAGSNAKAVGGGWGSGGTAKVNLGLRDLGRRVEDQIDSGITAASQWLAQSQVAPLYNLGNMFLSSDQLLAFQFKERDAQHANKLMQAQVKAAPDPWSAAMAGEIDRLFNTFAQVGMASMGGGMGSMGGMMGGGGGGTGGVTPGTAGGKGVG